jgi:hypothetical protein
MVEAYKARLDEEDSACAVHSSGVEIIAVDAGQAKDSVMGDAYAVFDHGELSGTQADLRQSHAPTDVVRRDAW